MVGFYRLFTFFAHDVRDAPTDSVGYGVDHALTKMGRSDVLALRNSAALLVKRCEQELMDRQTEI